MNIALYQPQRRWWALTEYASAPRREGLHLGNNRWQWRDNQTLCIDVDERTAPWRTPLRGRITLHAAGGGAPLLLHRERPHHWWPVAPCARVEVDMQTPACRWEGRAYHDANWGDEPLGQAFRAWHWQRSWRGDGTWVHYDTQPCSGAAIQHSVCYQPDGRSEVLPALPWVSIGKSHWGLAQKSRGVPMRARLLEDTPFYTRGALALGEPEAPGHAMHEHLDLQRFDRRWVQFLLPFRMRRGP